MRANRRPGMYHAMKISDLFYPGLYFWSHLDHRCHHKLYHSSVITCCHNTKLRAEVIDACIHAARYTICLLLSHHIFTRCFHQMSLWLKRQWRRICQSCQYMNFSTAERAYLHLYTHWIIGNLVKSWWCKTWPETPKDDCEMGDGERKEKKNAKLVLCCVVCFSSFLAFHPVNM